MVARNSDQQLEADTYRALEDEMKKETIRAQSQTQTEQMASL